MLIELPVGQNSQDYLGKEIKFETGRDVYNFVKDYSKSIKLIISLALPLAVGLANVAASIVVAKLGTATVSAPELRRAVQQDAGSERGALTQEQLQIAVADARSQGEKVVFTNGCFDVLHAGHVAYL